MKGMRRKHRCILMLSRYLRQCSELDAKSPELSSVINVNSLGPRELE